MVIGGIYKMKFYFAGSIRGEKADREVYEKIINYLKNYGEVLTEHIGKMNGSGESDLTDAEIFERDIIWLQEADLVIAEVTSPSLGVGYEIGKAEEYGKKILCLYQENSSRKLSAMVSGNKNLELVVYTKYDGLLTELFQKIDEFLKE
jgi:nucleoside 2-deoxyribosyltransferase